jgi:hypothetical membrane protein
MQLIVTNANGGVEEQNRRDWRLLTGPLAACIFGIGVVGLSRMIPGYSQVRQTVSEIGEVGSPARWWFALLLCVVAACLLIFSAALRRLAIQTYRSRWPAYFVAYMAIPAAGIGIFAYPHSLHNVFGMLEIVGYQAPLVMAVTWRRDLDARTIVRFSFVMAMVVWMSIGLNLTTLHRYGNVWDEIRPMYGVVQRSLFGAWFAWCGVVGLLLYIGSPEKRGPAD